jgi:hypothetical protein
MRCSDAFDANKDGNPGSKLISKLSVLLQSGGDCVVCRNDCDTFSLKLDPRR